jgi:hypothetical protein
MPSFDDKRDRDDVEVQFASRVITELRGTAASIKTLSRQIDDLSRSLAEARTESAKETAVVSLIKRVDVLEDADIRDRAASEAVTNFKKSIIGGSLIGAVIMILQIISILRSL